MNCYQLIKLAYLLLLLSAEILFNQTLYTMKMSRFFIIHMIILAFLFAPPSSKAQATTTLNDILQAKKTAEAKKKEAIRQMANPGYGKKTPKQPTASRVAEPDLEELQKRLAHKKNHLATAKANKSLSATELEVMELGIKDSEQKIQAKQKRQAASSAISN